MSSERSGARHLSSTIPLALAFAALVLYASLYPFEGWRWPPGQRLAALLVLPATRWLSLDAWLNVAGYVPLGALVFLALRRSAASSRAALGVALLAPALLSWTAEVLQQFLPGRVPAREDWLANVGGGAIGAALAVAAQKLGLIDRWQGFRERWLERGSGGALALLALWPVALLFPAPATLGLGQIGPRLVELGAAVTKGVPWADELHALLSGTPAPLGTLNPLNELLLTALGLLAPCLLAFVVGRGLWRRAVLACGALALACAATTLSTFLNYGPQHALAWLTPTAARGFALGFAAALALALLPLPRRVLVGLGLLVLAGLVTGVAQAPSDPYFAQSLQDWEQGRFVRLHGLAQWIGWLWPYAAMGWLLLRLARREPG